MVHYVLVKITNQVVSYYACKQAHTNHNDKSKITCPNWQGSIFYTYHFGFFLIKKYIFCSSECNTLRIFEIKIYELKNH
jgi:hypothetical protein